MVFKSWRLAAILLAASALLAIGYLLLTGGKQLAASGQSRQRAAEEMDVG